MSTKLPKADLCLPICRSRRPVSFEAIQFVRSIKDRPLTTEDVLELHRITTADALENPDAAGRLQTPADERVAVMLHFRLAYDHPFEDGNGRTARALFYWAMLHANYWLFEYVSISSILKNAFAQYGKSYLYSESNENDATYFLIHQLDVMLRAIGNLDQYLQRKIAQIREVETRLGNVASFNHRQLALLGHALRHPGTEYTIKSHQRSHNVAYIRGQGVAIRAESGPPVARTVPCRVN